MERKYEVRYFVDVLQNGKLVARKVTSGRCSYYCGSWREFLCYLWAFIDEAIFDKFGHEFYETGFHFCIGLIHTEILCDGKKVDFNYVNRVIYKDGFLRKVYYC